MPKKNLEPSSKSSEAFGFERNSDSSKSRSSFEIVAEPFDTQHPLYPNEPPPPYISNLPDPPPPRPSNRRRRRTFILICAILCILMFIGFIAGMSVSFARKQGREGGDASAVSTGLVTGTMTAKGSGKPTITSSTSKPKITKDPKNPVTGKVTEIGTITSIKTVGS